jgi:hypothetical protein
MRRITLGIALLAVGGLVVLAGPNLANASTKAAAAVAKSGPYSYVDTDGGTCGNLWAVELGLRTFTQPNQDPAGNYSIVETFSQGHFSTTAGMSPGACDPQSRANNGHLVREGVPGTFFGNEHVFIQGGGAFLAGNGTCNGFPSSDSDNPCTTASYVAYHYGSSATTTITSYGFTYKSSAAGVLAPKSWVEKSTDGNTEFDTGDIHTS